MKPGPKKGYKQTVSHVLKRKRFGEDHHAWKGDDVSTKGGRTRALRRYPEIGSCVACGELHAERHHLDEDTANNEPDNIVILCRRCHMQKDGRLEEFRALALSNLTKARDGAAAKRRSKTHCPKGHPYSGTNLYINSKGSRSCRQCLNDYKRNKRAGLI